MRDIDVGDTINARRAASRRMAYCAKPTAQPILILRTFS
jgi:hypothetical protein